MLLKLLSNLKKNLLRGKPIKSFLECCFSAAGGGIDFTALLWQDLSDMELIQIRIKSIGKNTESPQNSNKTYTTATLGCCNCTIHKPSITMLQKPQ